MILLAGIFSEKIKLHFGAYSFTDDVEKYWNKIVIISSVFQRRKCKNFRSLKMVIC